MTFRIGFPVDGGTGSHSFVTVVRLCPAKLHSCKGGGVSGLRRDSGAAFVFARAGDEFTCDYRFEFEPLTAMVSNIRPDSLADCGSSDAVACLLALLQRGQVDEEAPLIVVSCSLEPQEPKWGLLRLSLRRVAGSSEDKSLLNKWQAACHEGAAALVLHEQDAKQLVKQMPCDCRTLSKDIFHELRQNPINEPIVISCRENQLILLAKSLGLPTTFLHRTTKRHGTTIVLLAIVAALIVFSLIALQQLGEIQQSIRNIQKALPLAPRHQFFGSQAVLREVAGSLEEAAEGFARLGRYREALACYQNAQHIYIELKDDEKIAKNFATMKLLEIRGKPEKSRNNGKVKED